MDSKGLSNYVVGEMLGQGNYGVVYSAKHIHTGQEVAIKFETYGICPSLLKHEARVLLCLKGCTGIPKLIAYGVFGGIKYLIMEKMRHKVSPNELALFNKTLVNVRKELEMLLRTIHKKGFVHRDVKPDNIMLDFSGNVTLIDFGFATSYSSKQKKKSSKIVGTRSFLGPLGLAGYICPEVDNEGVEKSLEFYQSDLYEKLK